jgi:hypothetical protein
MRLLDNETDLAYCAEQNTGAARVPEVTVLLPETTAAFTKRASLPFPYAPLSRPR